MLPHMSFNSLRQITAGTATTIPRSVYTLRQNHKNQKDRTLRLTQHRRPRVKKNVLVKVILRPTPKWRGNVSSSFRTKFTSVKFGPGVLKLEERTARFESVPVRNDLSKICRNDVDVTTMSISAPLWRLFRRNWRC